MTRQVTREPTPTRRSPTSDRPYPDPLFQRQELILPGSFPLMMGDRGRREERGERLRPVPERRFHGRQWTHLPRKDVGVVETGDSNGYRKLSLVSCYTSVCSVKRSPTYVGVPVVKHDLVPFP